jgi:hypothetical protein
MPFYMNPFDQEFRGDLLLADRKHIPTFVVPPNKNKSDQMVAWNNGPYDLSSFPNLTINYAIDPSMKAFSPFTVNIAGATPAATQVFEIVAALNANSNFSALFTACQKTWVDKNQITQTTVFIQSKRPAQSIRVFIANSGAEQVLKFNLHAGIAEIPSFFARHLITNWMNPESEAKLIRLDETDAAIDLPIIRTFVKDPTWTASKMKADYQLIGGRSGLFTFKKQTVDGTNRVTSIIEYPAGAVAGDFAKKTTYSYSSSNTNPDVIAEVPYVLVAGDLITPP